MPQHEHWVAMPIIRAIVLGAERKGASAEEICARIGITRRDLDELPVLETIEANDRTWLAAVELSGDPYLPLHIGEGTTPMVTGLLGPLMETSPDVRHVFRNLIEYTKTFTQIFEYSFYEEGDRGVLQMEPLPMWIENWPDSAHYSVEMGNSAIMHILRLLTGRHVTPLSVEFRHHSPRDTSEYARVFRVLPKWRTNGNRMTFSKQDLGLAVIGHNRELHAHFKRVLDQELARLETNATIRGEVRRTILEQFQMKLPRLSDVASLLNLSERSLQRKLMQEGTSFQQVCDDVRRELAQGLLKNQKLTVAEIAYRLGYTEPSTFQRAFRQWTGSTPRMFRSTVADAHPSAR